MKERIYFTEKTRKTPASTGLPGRKGLERRSSARVCKLNRLQSGSSNSRRAGSSCRALHSRHIRLRPRSLSVFLMTIAGRKVRLGGQVDVELKVRFRRKEDLHSFCRNDAGRHSLSSRKYEMKACRFSHEFNTV